MSILSSLGDEIQAFKTKLSSDASHLLAEFESLIGKLGGQAKTDAAQVAQEAQPVIATAEHDAAALATEAVAGAEGIAAGGAKPSA